MSHNTLRSRNKQITPTCHDRLKNEQWELTECSSDKRRLVLPIDEKEVRGDARTGDEEPHAHLVRPDIQGKEHQEATHQQEGDGYGEVNLLGKTELKGMECEVYPVVHLWVHVFCWWEIFVLLLDTFCVRERQS